MCDLFLDAHKIMHPILSLKLGVIVASVPMCIAWAECAIHKGGSIFPCHGNLAATNLLGKLVKGFIVNPTNLPW